MADRRLDNVLRALLQPGFADPNDTEASRVYASAATVLTSLTNPLNVSLLSTQILVSPAIWQTSDRLKASLQTFSVFQSATLGKIEQPGFVIPVEEWIAALVRGANQNVPRWKHLLLLGGVLSAEHARSHLPRITRRSLEDAFCRAINLSAEASSEDGLEADVLSLILSHSMQSLSRMARSQLKYDALLPAAVKSVYYSSEGFQSGYFLSAIDHDIMTIGGKISWPSKSNSFLELQERSARPLFLAMSQLAHLGASAIRETQEIHVLYAFLEDLVRFSATMSTQWNAGRLSTIAPSDEATLVDEQTLKTTIPVLWQILKTALFTTTMLLQELMARVMGSQILCSAEHGTNFSSKVLQVLRSLYFITFRLGSNAFSSYNFVYLSAIDILSSHSQHAALTIAQLSPARSGSISVTFSERLDDLYLLNTAENLATVLPAATNEDLLVPLASLYLTPGSDGSLRSHFEAAHSLMLAILGAQSSAHLASRLLPFYLDVVFTAFPSHLSARQFRLALSTLVRLCSPPLPLSSLQPNLVEVILEVLHDRATKATTSPLPSTVDEGAVGLSEMDICILALTDALASMDVQTMEAWLEPITRLFGSVGSAGSEQRLKERFWNVLSGELDVARAEVAVRWWNTGGREKVFPAETGVRAML